MSSGKIKTWLSERGFGFIVPDGGGPDIFCHVRDVENRAEPIVGDRVTFDAVPSERRPGSLAAKNVRLAS